MKYSILILILNFKIALMGKQINKYINKNKLLIATLNYFCLRKRRWLHSDAILIRITRMLKLILQRNQFIMCTCHIKKNLRRNNLMSHSNNQTSSIYYLLINLTLSYKFIQALQQIVTQQTVTSFVYLRKQQVEFLKSVLINLSLFLYFSLFNYSSQNSLICQVKYSFCSLLIFYCSRVFVIFDFFLLQNNYLFIIWESQQTINMFDYSLFFQSVVRLVDQAQIISRLHSKINQIPSKLNMLINAECLCVCKYLGISKYFLEHQIVLCESFIFMLIQMNAFFIIIKFQNNQWSNKQAICLNQLV
ncbi:hypothetical protein ABPG72_014893 [Tetrahymena utriculariae]